MLKYIRIFFGLACFAVLAFVLHVPLLKYWTAPASSSELNAYANLPDGVDGQTYKIEQIVDGNTLEIFYDPTNRIYVIAVEFFEYDQEDYSGRHIILLEENGDLRDIRRIDQEHLDILFDAINLERVARIGGRQYFTDYSFSNYSGVIDLVHYQFQKFKEWPYLFYFIPMIPSDWNGMAYLKINHDTEVFKVKIQTEYSGGFLYSLRYLDGQIYLRQRPDGAAGLTFLQVDESSYLQGMDGQDTHREGYGLYVIRHK